MNNFYDFDDYRVGAWKDRSLMIRLEEVVNEIAVTIKSSVAIAAAACAVVASTVLAPSIATAQTSEVSKVHFSFQTADSTEADLTETELASLSSAIDQELASLMDFSIIDESTLALANKAVTAMANRSDKPMDNWADKLFLEGV